MRRVGATIPLRGGTATKSGMGAFHRVPVFSRFKIGTRWNPRDQKIFAEMRYFERLHYRRDASRNDAALLRPRLEVEND
jgi:hypothetical protein